MALCSARLVLVLLLSAVPVAYIIHSETSDRAAHVYAYASKSWFRECAKWDHLNRRFIVSFFEGGVGDASILEEITVIGDSGFEGEKTFADDVAVDTEGNAYVTDVKGSKLWKVGVNGELLYTINSPLFIPKEWYYNLIGLNGIVYHPNGYLLVEIGKGDVVKEVNIIGGSLMFGDGLELISPTKIAVAGNAIRLVESTDDWETARIVGKSKGLGHCPVTAATVKEGKVYLNHLVGFGYPKRKHVLVEAIFT
ncbi:hypothetical protein SASPL_104292 [Salvia splendens]|uniref:Uncharacterized protein n=1 Tax=Salvia splendens TaxID=180675 RepID=A0A8X9A7K2_SALSN|nr:hypothetical protein SASPL_104292 [Salvia splendens]